MKRFRRWLFNGLAAMSLVLCLAIMGLWVWSGDWRHATNGLGHETQINSELYAFGLQPGYINVWRIGPMPFEESPVEDLGVLGWNHSTEYFGLHVSWWSHTGSDSVTTRWLLLGVPFWWFLLLTSWLPALWAIHNFAAVSKAIPRLLHRWRL